VNHWLFGKLTLDALPHVWYTVGGTLFLALSLVALAFYLTKKRLWRWLWDDWCTTTDPKKIGTMYMIASMVMFFRGMVDAGMLWLQQAIAADNRGFLSADHFQEIFTSHGDIMVFFVTMGFFFGFMNWFVPLQIGTRDLAFPFLNSLGFWLYVAGACLINLFFVIGGEFANTGWLAAAPLSEIEFNPGVGVDYLIWSLQLSGLGSLIAGINFIVTIVKKRAPGMTIMKMPLFVWTSLCAMVLVISAFPVITATTFLLWLDRFYDFHFFTTSFGGNQMLYWNFIWTWGHPEVYILVIPAFGLYSEIVSTFAGRPIFHYPSMVIAAIAITLLSYLVWLHHFFTMGAGADVNSFFGIVTQFIAVPTGVQFFNWILTLCRGKPVLATPLYWFIGFCCTFILGGMAGVLLAAPPVDFQLHNSLFLVAHFHTQIIGGALFGIFAGFSFWFPKMTGILLNERLGKIAFWLWLIGFYVSFVPLYLLGFMGASRRLDHYDAATGWQPFFIVSMIGIMIIVCSICVQMYQIFYSFKERRKDTTGDPWNGRTLEWATSSPPPFYNFPSIPHVTDRDAFWAMKEQGKTHLPHDREIELPKNTGMGVYISAQAFFFGFAVVWHILWLAVASIAGIAVCLVVRSFEPHTEYIFSLKKES